jgi:hypothetical protein
MTMQVTGISFEDAMQLQREALRNRCPECKMPQHEKFEREIIRIYGRCSECYTNFETRKEDRV